MNRIKFNVLHTTHPLRWMLKCPECDREWEVMPGNLEGAMLMHEARCGGHK